MITPLIFSRTPQDQNYAQKICDPDDCLFEPTIAWLDHLRKVYAESEEELIKIPSNNS